MIELCGDRHIDGIQGELLKEDDQSYLLRERETDRLLKIESWRVSNIIFI